MGRVKGIGAIGVITDVVDQELPPNAWTSVSNIRFQNGSATNIPFATETLDEASKPDISTDYAYALHSSFNVSDRIYYATGSKLYEYKEAVHSDISGVGTFTASDDWDSYSFNNCVVFSNPTSTPQIKLPDEATFKDMPDWAVTWKTDTTIGYKNFIVALNMAESGVAYSQRIRWSDAAPPNEAPLSWDATDPTTLAGFNDLTDAQGEILTAATLGDTLYVYTTKEIFAMQYVGGASLFKFRKINTDIGLLNKRSMVPYKNGHVLVTRDNVYAFNGTTASSIIDSKIRDDFFDRLDLKYVDNMRLVTHPQFNEVWICYANSASVAGELNEAAVWNSERNIWSYRSLPDVLSIATLRKPIVSNEIWDDATYAWDNTSANNPWFTRDYGGDVLMCSTADGRFLLLDQSTTTTLPDSGVSTMERRYMDMDDFGVKSTGVKNVRALYPQFEGVGSINFTIGVSDSIGGAIAWSNPQTYVIGETTRLDFRTSGRYISIRAVTTLDTSNLWSFSGYEIEFEERFRGRRSR